MGVHKTAVIDSAVDMAWDVSVGPYSIIDQGSVISKGAVIGGYCHIFPGVHLGEGVRVYDGAVLGSEPQDLKYKGEQSFVYVGAGTRIREFVTVNKGTAAFGKTVIGRNCVIMTYSHIAHDCVLGDNVILANSVQMGGHVTIGNASVVSGMTGIHQFTTIGAGAFIGGGLRVAQDILPFSKALGEPLTWAGVNDTGLKKLGYQHEARTFVKKCYRELHLKGFAAFRQTLTKGSGTASEVNAIIEEINEFLRIRKRGILK